MIEENVLKLISKEETDVNTPCADRTRGLQLIKLTLLPTELTELSVKPSEDPKPFLELENLPKQNCLGI